VDRALDSSATCPNPYGVKPLLHYRQRSSAEDIGTMAVPVLLLDLPIESPISAGEFHTATRQDPKSMPTLEDVLQDQSVAVARLVKSPNNPYENFIFVGRAATCDIILRDASVSKSHAVFEKSADGKAWMLRDNRSHNGTWVNGQRLEPGARVALSSADALRFGSYPAYFLMPDPFRRILEMMAPVEA
jgi:pSer/pThr/pTyr-binding forkhead associated (FHA) protein